MGSLDDFMLHQARPALRPGETVLGTATMGRPTKYSLAGVPHRYDTFLVVPTNARLVLIATECGAFGDLASPPAAMNKGITTIEYSTLRQVEVRPVGGIGGGRALLLDFHPGFVHALADVTGSVRLDLFPSATGLDGQAQAHRGFGEWLQGQVQTGAFPMSPEMRAHSLAAAQAAAHQAAAQQQVAAAGKAESAAALSLAVRVGAPLACAALPLMFALFQLFQWVNYSGSVRAKERDLAAATNRYAREEHQHALDNLKGLQTQRLLLATVGLVLAVGIGGGGVLLLRKRQAST